MYRITSRNFRLSWKGKCFHSYGVPRNKIDSNLLLRDLSRSGQINEARQVFDKMPERDEFTWNTMIVAYTNSGKLSDAEQIFRRNPVKNTISWNALISGYCRYGRKDEAFALFWEMQFDGRNPNEYTLGSVLKMCGSLDSVLRGEQIHGLIVKTGFDSDVNVVNGLLAMYEQSRHIVEADRLFRSMSCEKNNVTWTSMLTGYSRNGYPYKAIECFRDMIREGNESNHFTFPSVLSACASVSSHRMGVQVHCCVVKSGFITNIYVQSAVIAMYAKCRDLATARYLLDDMEVDDVVSLNSVIIECVRQGLIEEALSLFTTMHKRDIKIDDFTIPSILNCFASSYSSSFRTNTTNLASSVHCLILKTGFASYKLVSNALIDMYAKRGMKDSAVEVFEGMKEKDVISWTALITGNTHNGSHEEALKLFCEMRSEGLTPDEIVTASVVSASAKLTLLEFGQQVHGDYIKSGFPSSLSVNNSLVTMYTECGSLEDANVIFDSMEIKDLITWTALIEGYAKNGKARESLGAYGLMIRSGLTPDYVTFIGLLFACCHAGLIKEGEGYFDSMRTVYNITPGPEHYACMIDLFGRFGDFAKTEELLNRMEFEPDATVWKSVLAACRKHGKIEIGEKAAKTLTEMEPKNSVPYVQLSNMYAAAGRLEEAANVRRLMKARDITKEPGCSWVEWRGKVHSFTSEDRRHPRTVEIYSKHDEMMVSIKEVGYLPDMSFALHDLDKEGKESGLANHSEKLAVAFGLLVVPIGAPIRVMKNLRVCGDCHNAMKYISRVYRRHIVLRDSNCFHHFRDGNCSCGDYW